MKKPLRILVVDDSMDDVELMLRELRRGGYDPVFERVETASAMKMMLEKQEWDVVLADHFMPFFNAIGALTQLQLSGLDIPFIIVSGSIGEDLAVSSMKAGAHDYIMKDNLARLVPAIERELIEVEERRKRRRAEEALRKSEASLANAQRIARLGNWEWDIVKNELYWSDEVYRIYGFAPQSFCPTCKAFLNLVHNDDREFVKKTVHDALYERKPYNIDYRIVLPDDSVRIVHEQAEVIFDNTGRAIQINGTVQDITERKQLERELRALNESLEQRVAERTAALMRVNEELRLEIEERKRIEKALYDSEEQYRLLFESNPHPMWVYDLETLNFLAVNNAAIHHYGYSREEFLAMTIKDIRPFEDIPALLDSVSKVTNGFDMAGIWRHRKKDGNIIYVEINSHTITFAGRRAELVLANDVTERKWMEEKIKHMAFHDSLTSLPNRILFNDRLTLALAHAHRNKEMLAVLFLDLDRFKSINDTLGHSAGDLLLHEIANRLKSCIREEDTVARFAGDEFTLLLSGINEAEDVHSIARKILDAIRQPLMIRGHELYITTSIGIAIYPNDGGDAETLLKNADTAMYHAKEQGRNNYQFYMEAMHAKSFEKMIMERNLRRALEREEFVVYYQPLVNIGTGQIVGMEALVRWRHPERGLITPEEFLALSENTRLIVFIDELVLYTVCVQCKAWQDAGSQPLCVAVNLSAHTFQQPNLVETVTSVLQKTGLDPHLLGLEITESIAMQDIEATVRKLSKLSDLGVQIAIDDFGTGFSSLYYLKKFPVKKLKISQHFVNGIVTDQNDKVIVESVIALAQSLKFKVVAEGVETKEQLIFLKQRQCDEMQGYLFCRPLPAEEFGKIPVQDKQLCGLW
ncbi:MAG: EAL domain-containing protein [Candidatus Brocadia sp.]